MQAIITDSGLNALLDIAFGDDAKFAAYYVGLIAADSFTEISASDTMSSHSGWTELTDYDEATRPTLVLGNPSGGVINNPATTEFTPNDNVDCIGYFITTVATKGGTTGTLMIVDYFTGGTQTLEDGTVERLAIEIIARRL